MSGMVEKKGMNMTEEQIAINRLMCGNTAHSCKADYIKTAIQALEEIQQYRAIGTVEEFKDLKEKNELKKPDYEGDGYYCGQIVLDTWICPNCEKHYEVDYDNYDYCPNCGQHIDHSGLTEDD